MESTVENLERNLDNLDSTNIYKTFCPSFLYKNTPLPSYTVTSGTSSVNLLTESLSSSLKTEDGSGRTGSNIHSTFVWGPRLCSAAGRTG